MLTKKEIDKFQSLIYENYAELKREFAWRSTNNPYHIFISEMMLQQTQTSRVIEKYELFIQKFPSFDLVASAPQKDLLIAWSGLGYNRRALFIQKTCTIITQEYGGQLPNSVDILKKFPGIGHNTAGAICAFAFSSPSVFIETNIRTVFIHTFFPHTEAVSDQEIIPLIKATVDHQNPRSWYYALMDYGVWLKQQFKSINEKSKSYKKQTPFKGSVREIRGTIIKLLTNHPQLSEKQIIEKITFDQDKIKNILQILVKENLIQHNLIHHHYFL